MITLALGKDNPSLEALAQMAAEGVVIVTEGNKPVSVFMPVDEEDLRDLAAGRESGVSGAAATFLGANAGGRGGVPGGGTAALVGQWLTAAMRLFHRTKTFPAEERFSLTDQMRRAVGVGRLWPPWAGAESRSYVWGGSGATRRFLSTSVMVNDLLDLDKHHAKAQRAQRIHTEGVLAFFASWREPSRLSTTSLTSTEYEDILGKLNNMERKADSFCF